MYLCRMSMIHENVMIYQLWDGIEKPNQDDRYHYYVGALSPQQAADLALIGFGYKVPIEWCQKTLFPDETEIIQLYELIENETGYFKNETPIHGWYELHKFEYIPVKVRHHYIDEILKDLGNQA